MNIRCVVGMCFFFFFFLYLEPYEYREYISFDTTISLFEINVCLGLTSVFGTFEVDLAMSILPPVLATGSQDNFQGKYPI